MRNLRKLAGHYTPGEDLSPAGLIWAGIGVLLVVLIAAGAANAQSVVSQPTTVTLWAGTQDFNQFGLADITAPASGVILEGTAISRFTGKPVRHMWYGDSSNGLCRVDPEVDDPGVVPGPGLGSHHNIIQSCIGSIQATGFVPGQVAFDAATNTVYAVNISNVGAGIIRLHYIPSGANGHGTIDPVHVEPLMGRQLGRNAVGGCPMLTDPVNNLVPAQPVSAAIGPDGNLYVGFRRDGMILRVKNAATMDPANPADCQNNVEVPLFSADQRLGAGHTFGLGWIGHDLFGADNIAPWIKTNADQCLTPINGNVRCGPTAATEILATQVPGPQGGLISDAIYPTFPGNTLYAATLGVVAKITNVGTIGSMTLDPSYGGPFCLITGLTVDTRDLANEPLYVGVDCTGGAINGAGQIWKVTPAAAVAGPPAAPTNLVAVASSGQVTLTWTPTPNGQPITSYLVHASFVSNGSSVPDVTVNPTPGTTLVPNTVAVTGLTNGVSYAFQVQAVNGTGSSPFSSPSNTVSPQAVTVPGAPTAVVATAGNGSATVAWTPPTGNGNSPITSFTVTALVNGAPSGITAIVTGASTGANVTGLTNGTTYTLTVHATNAVGNSAESAPSTPVTPGSQPGNPDLAITMSSPASVNAGSFVTFTMNVTNNGPQPAVGVVLTDTLPAAFQTSTTTQGVCTATGFSFICNLGAMSPGASARITVTVAIGSVAVTNTASVQAMDAGGTVLTDPVPANNTASATTNVNASALPPVPAGGGGGGGGGIPAGGGGGGGGVPAGGGGGGGGVPAGGGVVVGGGAIGGGGIVVGGGVATDIQVVGSAQNGGPAVGSADTLTFQARDNQGATPAPGVVLNILLPPSFQFNSASASQGTCDGITAGSSGGTLTCLLGTVSGGSPATVTVNFTPTQVGTFGATAFATFAGTDTNPQNNGFIVTIRPR